MISHVLNSQYVSKLLVLFIAAMIPFWVYTLGTAVPANEEIGEMKIPFVDILISLLIIIVPVALGYLVKRKLPRFSAIVRKCLKVGSVNISMFYFARLYGKVLHIPARGDNSRLHVWGIGVTCKGERGYGGGGV